MQSEMVTPGFRLYPLEEELVSFYLGHKLEGTRLDIDQVIREVDIYAVEPWDLPVLWEVMQRRHSAVVLLHGSTEREAKPHHVKRVVESLRVTDIRVLLRQPTHRTGTRTKYKMNEYRAILTAPSTSTPHPQLRKEFNLCRVYVVSGSFRAFDRAAAQPHHRSHSHRNARFISTK